MKREPQHVGLITSIGALGSLLIELYSILHSGADAEALRREALATDKAVISQLEKRVDALSAEVSRLRSK